MKIPTILDSKRHHNADLYQEMKEGMALKGRGFTGMTFYENYVSCASHHSMKSLANCGSTCQNVINNAFYWPTNSNRSTSSVKRESPR